MDAMTTQLDCRPAETKPLSHEERSRIIRGVVRARSKELRERHPIMRYQSALGVTILTASAVVVAGAAVMYLSSIAAWWVVLPLSAFAMSFAHEIEHDTIHRMYFTRNKRAQNVMFAIVWLLRPYTVSPWVRKPLHLLHHEASGTERDYEERAITNGMAWSPLRLLMLVDPVIAAYHDLPKDPAARRAMVRLKARAYFPLGWIAVAVWYAFLALSAMSLLTGGSLVAGGTMSALYRTLTALTVVWIGPNVLRVGCLHFLSSNMHYYGDVEEGNVIEQTQVLNRWWLLPLQLFCCNFGSTHGIHHFVPGDPFYLRQVTAKAAHRAMRANGVRFNDMGTFRRANRFNCIDA